MTLEPQTVHEALSPEDEQLRNYSLEQLSNLSSSLADLELLDTNPFVSHVLGRIHVISERDELKDYIDDKGFIHRGMNVEMNWSPTLDHKQKIGESEVQGVLWDGNAMGTKVNIFFPKDSEMAGTSAEIDMNGRKISISKDSKSIIFHLENEDIVLGTDIEVRTLTKDMVRKLIDAKFIHPDLAKYEVKFLQLNAENLIEHLIRFGNINKAFFTGEKLPEEVTESLLSKMQELFGLSLSLMGENLGGLADRLLTPTDLENINKYLQELTRKDSSLKKVEWMEATKTANGYEMLSADESQKILISNTSDNKMKFELISDQSKQDAIEIEVDKKEKTSENENVFDYKVKYKKEEVEFSETLDAVKVFAEFITFGRVSSLLKKTKVHEPNEELVRLAA